MSGKTGRLWGVANSSKNQIKSSRATRMKEVKQSDKLPKQSRDNCANSSSPDEIIELNREETTMPSVFSPAAPVPNSTYSMPFAASAKSPRAPPRWSQATMQDMYGFIFGDPQVPDVPSSSVVTPSPTVDNSLLSFFGATPAFETSPNAPDFTIIHHYLDVVLPLQYRLGVSGWAQVVAPLAFTDPDVLASASSLAALHRSASRTSMLPSMGWSDTATSPDPDQALAVATHRASVQKIHSAQGDMSDERVIIPTLFALSFYLFLGGTATAWSSLLDILRKCLAAAFAASPEFGGQPRWVHQGRTRLTAVQQQPAHGGVIAR